MDDCKALAEQIPIIKLYHASYSQLHLAIIIKKEAYVPLQLESTCLTDM